MGATKVRAMVALQRKVNRALKPLRETRPTEFTTCGPPRMSLLREVLSGLLSGGTLTPRERHAAAGLLRTIAPKPRQTDGLEGLITSRWP